MYVLLKNDLMKTWSTFFWLQLWYSCGTGCACCLDYTTHVALCWWYGAEYLEDFCGASY